MAVPVTLSSSVMSIANLIDLTVISRQLQSIGFSEAGASALYGNYTTLDVPMFNLIPVLVYPIGYSLVPMVSALIVKNETLETKRVITSSLKSAAIIALPCTVGMAVLAKPILELIFKADSLLARYEATGSELLLDEKFMSLIDETTTSASLAAPLLSILAVSSFLVCMLAITNSVLQANKRPYLPLVSMLIGACAKVVASYLLIGNESVGIYGAPISTDICYVIVVLCNFYFCAKYANFRPSVVKVFLKPLISAALCGGAAIGVYTLATNMLGASRINTIAAIAAAAVVYFAAILLMRALDREDFEFIPAGRKLLKVLDKLHLVK